nr:neuronal acetylcholine receptor subunit alpha-10 isoform X2 [Anser cygnoides]
MEPGARLPGWLLALGLASTVLAPGCGGAQGRLAHKLLHDLFANYSSALRPAEDTDRALNVTLQVTLSQIIDMDERNQVLTSYLWVRQAWLDAHLTWDKDAYGGIDSIRIPSSYVWRPDIVLYNNADDRFSGSMETNVVLRSDGHIMWDSPAITKSSCKVDVSYFPFDGQQCRLTFGSWTYNGNQIDLRNRLDAGDLTDFVENVEWEVLGMPATRNVVTYGCCSEPYPDVTYTLLLKRRASFYIFNLLLPCVMISFLAPLGFYLPADSGEKVSLGVTVLLALTVFQLLVAESMPPSESVPLIGEPSRGWGVLGTGPSWRGGVPAPAPQHHRPPCREVLHRHHDHDRRLHRADHLHHERPPLRAGGQAGAAVGTAPHPAPPGPRPLRLRGWRELQQPPAGGHGWNGAAGAPWGGRPAGAVSPQPLPLPPPRAAEQRGLHRRLLPTPPSRPAPRRGVEEGGQGDGSLLHVGLLHHGLPHERAGHRQSRLTAPPHTPPRVSRAWLIPGMVGGSGAGTAGTVVTDGGSRSAGEVLGAPPPPCRGAEPGGPGWGEPLSPLVLDAPCPRDPGAEIKVGINPAACVSWLLPPAWGGQSLSRGGCVRGCGCIHIGIPGQAGHCYRCSPHLPQNPSTPALPLLISPGLHFAGRWSTRDSLQGSPFTAELSLRGFWRKGEGGQHSQVQVSGGTSDGSQCHQHAAGAGCTCSQAGMAGRNAAEEESRTRIERLEMWPPPAHPCCV